METPTGTHRNAFHVIFLCALLIIYWGISLRNITVVPAVHEDEPWEASTGWKLATEGVFGSDVFAGVYGMEQRYLQDYDFRSFIVPLVWADSGYKPRPLALDEALDRVAPDAVLLDGRIQAYFEEVSRNGDRKLELFTRWFSDRNGRLVATLDDSTYGVLRIYEVSRAPSLVPLVASRPAATINPSVIQKSKLTPKMPRK